MFLLCFYRNTISYISHFELNIYITNSWHLMGKKKLLSVLDISVTLIACNEKKAWNGHIFHHETLPSPYELCWCDQEWAANTSQETYRWTRKWISLKSSVKPGIIGPITLHILEQILRPTEKINHAVTSRSSKWKDAGKPGNSNKEHNASC